MSQHISKEKTEEDFIDLLSTAPDYVLNQALLSESRVYQPKQDDRQEKGRQKRFRSQYTENSKSPPPKRQHCEDLSHWNPKKMPLDCFSFSSPKSKSNSKSKLGTKLAFWPKRKPSNSCFIVKSKEMKMFFKLTEDDVIRQFLYNDSCCRVADKYLLAMVFAYFKRAGLSLWEYTRYNFFIALYLANDVEEDEEEIKYEIFPWALGKKWKEKYPSFLKKRDNLLRLIDYKAIVSRRCTDEIMAIEPDHALWKRERPQHHAGALRSYMKEPEDDGHPRGPDLSPRYCALCACDGQEDSQYDSASPDSGSWCILSSESSPGTDGGTEWLLRAALPLCHNNATASAAAAAAAAAAASSFDMKGLQKTLPTPDQRFPSMEE